MQVLKNPDFSGWATRNDLLCTDGRTIKKDAFKHCDGKQVPLFWNHQHNSLDECLGHVILHNRDEGIYSDGYFNDSENGKLAKSLLQHGDIRSLSIYANRLKEFGKNVIHGDIIEVSLVPAGANPGAFVDAVMAHGDNSEEEGLILGYDEALVLYHSAEEKNEELEKKDEKKKDEKSDDEETVAEVFNTLTEKQKNVVYAMIGMALSENNESDDNEEDDKTMKHNVFDNELRTDRNVICHSDQEAILNMAKTTSVGSLKAAIDLYEEQNSLQHTGGPDSSSEKNASGFPAYSRNDGVPAEIDYLFPEYRDVRPGAPELITNDQGWINVIMRKVHKSPFSRIRTRQVDIRNIDTLRAKGYKKGTEKSLTGNYNLVRRTTDPQTIYVKNALNRDDIIDITDFDYVQYQYNIDRMMLNEELATAIMVGDGREEGDPDKIYPDHIRPIWLDDELYTIHTDLDTSAIQGTGTETHFGENYIYAESIVNTVLYAREKYKGSGTPDFYCTSHLLNVMLLARDRNGRRIYNDKSDLARALNVNEIYTVEAFDNLTREVAATATETAKTKKLLGLIVNMADYAIGAAKGGEITHFSQFDIDFNQEKSLIETRCSGALTRIYSAIALEEDVTQSADDDGE